MTWAQTVDDLIQGVFFVCLGAMALLGFAIQRYTRTREDKEEEK